MQLCLASHVCVRERVLAPEHCPGGHHSIIPFFHTESCGKNAQIYIELHMGSI